MEAEAGGSEVQDCPQVYSEFKASLGYLVSNSPPAAFPEFDLRNLRLYQAGEAIAWDVD